MLFVLALMWLFGYGALVAAAYAAHPIIFILAVLFLA